ncbi:putative leucine-rich repeat-containing protein DDB_G0290503 isoform X2 [Halyomorpha halys]|uniref:putative leucine-rich repeat-containing protein DDB_G0290503 isoform X2 n=1 Tax=Halyomorpha halys TaxID=286706 RepID=UPI0006D4F4C8|nr:uncharacterized protein LOC106690652 isoform X2 [Halyomorpha halys]
MSADTLRKQSKQAYHGQVILPQAINDPSIIESVAGFIHEVVPQAYTSVLPGESRDGILWARFDSTDYNDPENFPPLGECESESTVPLLLVLGYSSGVQVWSVGGSGEATELLSWCQGAVRALRFLLKPYNRDPHTSKRPLVAIVDSSSPGPQFSTLSFISLKTAEVVKIIKFNSPICDVHCNRKSIVVTFNERIAVFDSATLEDRLTITTCYLSPGNSPNPIALGTRWLAYGEKRLTTWQRSSGGCEGDGAQSYTSAVIHAAKSLGKGLRELGGSLTGSSPQSSQNAHAQPGIVSIIDIERKGGTSEEERGNMIAHFVAHTSAVVAMSFDPSGLLLITADRHGHRFNVFRIHPHPCTSQLAAVHHLYILHRGETTARVQDIAVSWDSRWVAISSVRGTTHVFPITPYGGLVTVRTHTTPHVVNRLSRFERSAGLRDGRGSPLPCEAPPTPPPPRLPPYPHPSVISPLAQLRARPDDSPLAATFGPPRAWLPGRPKSKRTCADSLYVISNSGVLLQYDLDPKCVQGIAKEKISYDTAIEVGVEAKAEWVLPKPPYSSSLCPPLPSGHVFLDLPPRPQPPPDKWLSQVEIVTHTGPHRRLWMGPQFTFKSIDPLPTSGCDEGGMDSSNPLRSNPVNMPHRPYLLVETSSGGSVGSPQTDTDEAGGRLREDLADAMLETQLGSGQARGKLRRAEVEWQVNPLGAVQTHPLAVVTHWPHPLFFEPFPVNVSKDGHLAPDTITEASVDKELSEESSDIIVDTIKSENVESYSFEKLEKQPASDILKFDVDNREVFVHESLAEKELCECEVKVSYSFQPKDVKKSNASRNIPSLLVSNSEPFNDSGKEQSEISSSDKEGATCIEQSAIKTQESEEKSSKVVGRKGRKKRKKDISSKPPMTYENISSVSQKDDNQKEHEPFLQDTVANEILLITEEDSSEQIKISIEQEIDVSCNLKDDIELNQSSTSLEMHLKPLQEVESDFIMDDHPSSSIVPIDKPHSEEIHESTNEGLSDFNLIIESEAISDNLMINKSYGGDILISRDNFNVDDDNNKNCDLGTDKLVITEEISSISNVHASHLIALDEADIIPVTEEDIPVTEEDIPVTEEDIPVTEEDIPVTEEDIPVTKEDIIPPYSDKNINIEETEILSLEVDQSLLESDMNGNRPPICTDGEEKNPQELLISFENQEEQDCASISNNPICEGESSHSSESPSIPTEDLSDNFVKVPIKNGRNSKNKRRKKDKKSHDSSLLADISEIDSYDSVSAKTDEAVMDSPKKLVSEIESERVSVRKEIIDSTSVLFDVISVCETVPEALMDSVEMNESTLENSLKCLSTCCEVPRIFSEDIQSDQIASTDKSEVEDISSHSGKESDDSKINKKERSRRQKRSESSDKDRSDKKKSPSPATARAEVKDSESSDESCQVTEAKTAVQKVPKRKKGKKNDETSEIQLKVKESSEMIDTTTEGPKDKSSDSSNEYSSEKPTRKQSGNRSWSNVVSIGDQRCNIEDRDSVYESCNDDGASDSLAFESSKEDFDESALKTPVLELTSSNTEEKTDSSDKLNQISSKKLRKQKKKKR